MAQLGEQGANKTRITSLIPREHTKVTNDNGYLYCKSL